MKQALIFKTGETTCSEKPSYPGSMCPFVKLSATGATANCGFFVDGEKLKELDGFLMRKEKCMATFKGAHEI